MGNSNDSDNQSNQKIKEEDIKEESSKKESNINYIKFSII